MTISAQQFKIFRIRFPILETATHYINTVLWTLLLGWVFMMNIKTAKIIHAAFTAFASQGFNNAHLSFPLIFSMNWAVVFIPIFSLTFWCAKPSFTRLTTALAFTIIGPSMGKIARLRAKLSGSLIDPILMCKKNLSAMLADDFDFIVSHNHMISYFVDIVEPKYFDIACRRIADAWAARPRLFEEVEKKPVQGELM